MTVIFPSDVVLAPCQPKNIPRHMMICSLTTRSISITDKHGNVRKDVNADSELKLYQRAENYTAANLTTSSENVQAAESTIRDADMAKEMTEYTKNNVLSQAAQAMLAQANQSASSVISLLQ